MTSRSGCSEPRAGLGFPAHGSQPADAGRPRAYSPAATVELARSGRQPDAERRLGAQLPVRTGQCAGRSAQRSVSYSGTPPLFPCCWRSEYLSRHRMRPSSLSTTASRSRGRDGFRSKRGASRLRTAYPCARTQAAIYPKASKALTRRGELLWKQSALLGCAFRMLVAIVRAGPPGASSPWKIFSAQPYRLRFPPRL